MDLAKSRSRVVVSSCSYARDAFCAKMQAVRLGYSFLSFLSCLAVLAQIEHGCPRPRTLAALQS
jgi:hypothetical protein